MNKGDSVEKCYMCDVEGNIKEYVFFKCIFFEVKDVLSGDNYKKNFIIVCFCEKYNMVKLKDDVYLLFFLVVNVVLNDFVQMQFGMKIMRVVNRIFYVFVQFVKKNILVIFKGENGELIYIVVIEIDCV